MVHRRLAVAALLAILALCLAACGSRVDSDFDSQTTADVPGGADPADVEVIQGWVDTLAAGDVEGAADYFAIPSIAENGATLIRIDSIDEARLFNQSLPCGAELVSAEPNGDLTEATFRLIERPGPGTCGSGAGHTAKTAFLIEDGKIAEWRRVPSADDLAPPIDGTVT